jgi:dienelactone hydrolase
LALLALAMIGVGAWRLVAATEGVSVDRLRVGSTPVTVFAPSGSGPAPVVVIGHGFAGSQQLMQPFAATLARNGYVAVTFDFAGHGRNPSPMPGGLVEHERRTAALVDEARAVAGFARALPRSDGRLALLGHSMANEVLARLARQAPQPTSLVAVSPFLREGTADGLRNLLIVLGAWEPAVLRDQALRAIAGAAGGAPRAGVTYGSFEAGTARRLEIAPGVEHIAVLYAGESLAAALAWLDQAFERRGSGFVDTRGLAIGLLVAGVVLLAWPLSQLLPRVAARPLGATLGWRDLVLVGVLPAVATPLVLWPLPTRALPLLMGDYLVLHFALYGLLTFVALRLVEGFGRGAGAPTAWPAFAAAALAATAYATLALGSPIDRWVTAVAPAPHRLGVAAALVVGTALYFAADEWATRGEGARRGAYAFTKACFLVSLALAIALDVQRLFFLIIIVPVMLAFFVVFGLFSAWAYRRTNHPLVGAAMNAVVFALAIAMTFPMVDR